MEFDSDSAVSYVLTIQTAFVHTSSSKPQCSHFSLKSCRVIIVYVLLMFNMILQGRWCRHCHFRPTQKHTAKELEHLPHFYPETYQMLSMLSYQTCHRLGSIQHSSHWGPPLWLEMQRIRLQHITGDPSLKATLSMSQPPGSGWIRGLLWLFLFSWVGSFFLPRI